MKVVDRTDVGMIELRAELGFAFEAFEVGCLYRQFRRKDLYYDSPVKLGVESPIDRPLSTLADLFLDLVLIDLRTDHKHSEMRNADCGY